MRDLFEFHPEATRKKGPGIKSVIIRHNVCFKQREFAIERVDGQVWNMSFIACLRKPSLERVFQKACRSTIVEQILAFKHQSFKHHKVLPCAITGKPVMSTSCHVDHFNPEFKQITLDFRTKEGISSLKDIKYVQQLDSKDVGFVYFEDVFLQRRFEAYHASERRSLLSSVGSSACPPPAPSNALRQRRAARPAAPLGLLVSVRCRTQLRQ